MQFADCPDELVESVADAPCKHVPAVGAVWGANSVDDAVKDVRTGGNRTPAGKPTLLTRTAAPDVVVLRETFDNPRDEEWDDFLRLLDRSRDLAKLRILVITDGGGPNAAQRARLQTVLKGRAVRVAIVTDSAKSRFIASAVSLFNRDHRGFSRAEIPIAYSHLQLTASECRAVEATLQELEPLIK